MSRLQRVALRWTCQWGRSVRVLGDAWERSYGELEWRGMVPERILPWYALVSDGSITRGFGVRAGAAAMCFWQLDGDGLTLWLDVRNGGRGVNLGPRRLKAATIWKCEGITGESPFEVACRLCGELAVSAIQPNKPVVGGNNWYYAYGENCSAELTLRDCEIISDLTPKGPVRPWMVIDDGWSVNRTAGPWQPNARYPDMPKLTSEMRKRGVRPGIWMRPLLTREKVPVGWLLGGRESSTLDPTVPEVSAQIAADVTRLAGWGFELIKHDFSSFDLLGRWGFAWNAQITDETTKFADGARTNAEIIRDLYALIRQASPGAEIIACNAVGHLTVGLASLQRIGDDTSGKDWNRTRKMGVNTLAFRLPQHRRFFGADPDCLGLMTQVPWELNRQWLDLVARSGMPLFVSIDPRALGAEQKQAIREAFVRSVEIQSKAVGEWKAEPVDWMNTVAPSDWRFGQDRANYDWFAAEGASPFGV